jgi:hypothetical protein
MRGLLEFGIDIPEGLERAVERGSAPQNAVKTHQL